MKQNTSHLEVRESNIMEKIYNILRTIYGDNKIKKGERNKKKHGEEARYKIKREQKIIENLEKLV